MEAKRAASEVATSPRPVKGILRSSPPSARRAIALGIGGLALATLLGLVLFLGGGTSSGTSDVISGLGNPAGNLLQLDNLGSRNEYRPAPFTLTDQHGQRVSLSQLRGKVVVLSFNDDRCPDLCTLLAQDVVVADRDLGAAAQRVVFLSVNVNPFYPQVRYIKQWADNHGLGTTPNWVSTTGTVPQLKAVWHRYGVYVGINRKTRTVVHGTQLFFINPAGWVVGIGQFGTNAANTSLYGHAMARLAVDLSPGGSKVRVRGPSVPAPTTTNAAVGAPAPSFTLPLLTNPHRTLSASSLRGRYVVLNFWASTCTACKQEMPHVERVFRQLGKKVAFVGVDVSDAPSTGLDFAKRMGATYPLVSDASGSLAGAYQVSGLPFTAIIGPGNRVLIRHPGALTTEQLRYIVESETQGIGGS